jgi:hypothetical protein
VTHDHKESLSEITRLTEKQHKTFQAFQVENKLLAEAYTSYAVKIRRSNPALGTRITKHGTYDPS